MSPALQGSVTSVLIAGVGGQGTILAGKVMAGAALLSGLDVKLSETHGMAQRGGSVITQVRFGTRIWSPGVDPGTADILLAFERLEALRWAHYLRWGGDIVVSTQVVNPMPVLMGTAVYPGDIVSRLQRHGHVVAVDAPALAAEAGNPRTANIVLVGAAARCLELERTAWTEALKASVSPAYLEVNVRAFELGWSAGAILMEGAT